MFPDDGSDGVKISEYEQHGAWHCFDGRHDTVEVVRRHLLHVFHILRGEEKGLRSCFLLR